MHIYAMKSGRETVYIEEENQSLVEEGRHMNQNNI